jgi:hypothetical protein
MTAAEHHALVVRDFILAACCTPCKNVLRREPQFVAMVANALSTRAAAEPAPVLAAKDNRAVDVMSAAFLLFIGGCFGWGARALLFWFGGIR